MENKQSNCNSVIKMRSHFEEIYDYIYDSIRYNIKGVSDGKHTCNYYVNNIDSHVAIRYLGTISDIHNNNASLAYKNIVCIMRDFNTIYKYGIMWDNKNATGEYVYAAISTADDIPNIISIAVKEEDSEHIRIKLNVMNENCYGMYIDANKSTKIENEDIDKNKKENNYMCFDEAYMKMLEGHKITRPCFKGYWYINGVIGKPTIHLASGEEITSGDLSITLPNVLAKDWIVLE